MKTRMFVAEVMWLFVGMCLCPLSVEQLQDVEERTSQQPTKAKDCVLRNWYCSGSIRPPPRDPPGTSRTQSKATV
jgi:hypothetical protein